MAIIGIHTNAQNKPLADLMSIWTFADQAGYGWISISDHFAGSLGPDSNEAVATHTAMATCTERAQCGVLVYSAGFRHPAVLAAAATTIDHLSGGRAAIGLGAGSAPADYEIYGFPRGTISERMDLLEESAHCLTGLLRGESVTFAGTYFRLNGARNGPQPVQPRLPVWIGTGGEKRGLRIAARYGDGWNHTFPALDVFARKRRILGEHCVELGRDPAELRCSVNLMLGLGEHAERIPPTHRAAALTGTTGQVADRVRQYADAGADQVNFFLSHPWDYDGLAALAVELGLPSI